MAAPYYNRKNAQTNQLSKCFEGNNLEARAKRDKHQSSVRTCRFYESQTLQSFNRNRHTNHQEEYEKERMKTRVAHLRTGEGLDGSI